MPPSFNFVRRALFLFQATCVALFVSACGESGEPLATVVDEPLELIGAPPQIAFYGANFEYQFTVAGGRPPYRYRYLSSPPTDPAFDFDEPDTDNPLELSIDVNNDANASFWLRGLPLLSPEDSVDGNAGGERYTYYIEVTDGVDKIVEEFEIALQQTQLIVTTPRINEGTDALTQLGNFQLQIANQPEVTCQSAKEEGLGVPSDADISRSNYYLILARLTSPLDFPLSIPFELRSDYDENLPERDSANIAFAREGTDFRGYSGVMRFNPGEQFCALQFEGFDDSIVEADENLSLFFTDELGYVDLSGANTAITMVDDEPTPQITLSDTIVSIGENARLDFDIRSPAFTDIDIVVSTDVPLASGEEELDLTGAFNITPESGVVRIQRGTSFASASVELLDPTVFGGGLGLDRRIDFLSDIDEIEQGDESRTIVFNEWPYQQNLDFEVVASSSENEQAIDFAVSEVNGLVYVLIESVSSANEAVGKIKAYYRDGRPYDFGSGSNEIVIEKRGRNITPKRIVIDDDFGRFFFVLFQVDGEWDGVSYGGTDFVLARYQLNEEGGSATQLVSSAQYGSEENDLVSSLVFDNDSLFITGSSEGARLDGQLPQRANSGLRDGFVYKLSATSLAVESAFYVGTTKNESAISVDVSSSSAIVLLDTALAGDASFLRHYELDGIELARSSTIADFEFVKANDRQFKEAIFSDDGLFNYILTTTRSQYLTNDLTLEGSLDVELVLTSKDARTGDGEPFLIQTSADDIAEGMAVLPDQTAFAVLVTTEGVIEGQNKIGTAGSDVILASFEAEGAGLRNPVYTQFGTPGNDEGIAVRSVSEDKFMVLWSEDHSAGDGAITYRLSAFSPAGRKLSLNPN